MEGWEQSGIHSQAVSPGVQQEPEPALGALGVKQEPELPWEPQEWSRSQSCPGSLVVWEPQGDPAGSGSDPAALSLGQGGPCVLSAPVAPVRCWQQRWPRFSPFQPPDPAQLCLSRGVWSQGQTLGPLLPEDPVQHGHLG